ncbi:MAG: hypothetical protein QXU18_06720 [Thermoplasmatales archaeon]
MKIREKGSFFLRWRQNILINTEFAIPYLTMKIKKRKHNHPNIISKRTLEVWKQGYDLKRRDRKW